MFSDVIRFAVEEARRVDDVGARGFVDEEARRVDDVGAGGFTDVCCRVV